MWHDSAPRVVVTMLAAWLLVVTAVAAGVVLGAYVVMTYVAAYLSEAGHILTGGAP